MIITSLPENYLEIIENNLNNTLIMRRDIFSYLLLRSDLKSNLEENKLIGGGNLLSLVGLMIMFSMLSKVFYILKNGDTVDIQRDNNINETEAFKCLINGYHKKIGLKKNDDGVNSKFWKEFRHKLVHINLLSEGNSSLTKLYNAPFYQVINHDSKDLPFEFDKESNKGIVNIDALLFELPKIKDWILQELKNEKFDKENILFLLNWYLSKDIIKII